MHSRAVIEDKAKGCLLGLAIGDALGTTIEFSARDDYTPVTNITGGGPFGLQAGQWTDDTSMALCLADQLLSDKGFDAAGLLNRFVNWMEYGYNSATGECFDIGNATRAALLRYRATGVLESSADPSNAGNGSIMRLAPAVLYSLQDRAGAIDLAVRQSRVTHAAPEALESCALMATILYDHITGGTGELPVINEPKVAALAQKTYEFKRRSEIRSTGYVIDTLEAALWAVDCTDNFKDAVLLAVNLGGDADTIGAVTGQLAGARWGYSNIPTAWLEKLAWRDKIEEMAGSLVAKGLGPQNSATPALTPGPRMA